jgi:hypothetical protein
LPDYKIKPIIFIGTLYSRGQAITFDNQGCGKVTLETDASQLVEMVKLAAYAQDSRLKVTVEIDDGL